MREHEKVLVVAAHPDDEVLGCGASLAEHADHGDVVWSMILGEGVASRAGGGSSSVSKQIKALRRDSLRANTLLGVNRVIHGEFPDNQLDSVPRLRIIQAIERVVKRFQPSLVYTHSLVDLNVDHQVVSEAARTACRPLPGASVREVLAFETPSATEWRFDPGAAFHPNVFKDVSRSLARKLEALKAYRGEVRDFPHPRSTRYLRALAEVRGAQVGVAAAEAFVLLRRLAPS